jgi:hypothetical protein
MDSKKLLTTAGGVVISLGVLFATIYVASKAWKEGQKNAEG